MRKLLLLLPCLFMLIMQVRAQTKTISGVVKDDKGTPLQNVSITVKNSSIGTTTNGTGVFSLTVPIETRSLTVSSVGYGTEEIIVTKVSSVEITLRPQDQNLNEVVVVAYGTSKKGALTNSVVQINSKDLENRPVTNVVSSIAGVAPGINATASNGQPGSAPAVRIRGFGSMNASNAPLYVVDGVPYDYDISTINVDDVENISVLKDAAASALYGARAANGVIQVTTKKGRKERTQITANISQGLISLALPEYDRVDAYEYYPLMWEAYRNSLVYPTSGVGLPIDSANKIATGLYPRNAAGLQVYNGKTYSDISQLLAYNPFNVGRTDIVRTNGMLNPDAQLLFADDLNWLRDIERNGNRGDYTVSMSGGAAKSDYYFSLGYTNEKGYVLNSDYKRYSGRLNINTQPLNWLKAGVNLATAVTSSNQGANDGSSTALVNPFGINRIIGPIYPVYAHNPTTGEYLYDANGNKIYDIGSLTALGLPNRPVSSGRHAIYETILNENIQQSNTQNGRAYADVSFLKYFSLTSNISVDIRNTLRSRYDNKIVGDGAPSGRALRNTTDNLTLTLNQLLNYKQEFGKHSVEALAGHESYSGTYKALSNLRTGQIIEGITELSNFTTTTSLTSSKDLYRIESYLSRLNYNFDDKYLLSGSFRRDGSSRFAQKSRWGSFWSVGAGWRIDREEFLQSIPLISSLKLRSSYGEVGNDDILNDDGTSNYYTYQALYGLGWNNNSEPGAMQSTTSGNPDLGWEVNRQFDAALEFGFFKNRISGTVEFFNRESSNLLFRVTPPLSTGTLSNPQNIGTMYNRGWEVDLSGDVLRSKDLVWNLGFNWTKYKNRITELPDSIITSSASGAQRWEVGRSRYDFYVRDWYGVDPNDGAALFVADKWVNGTSRITKNGDTVTTDHNNARMHYAGSSIPDFFGAVKSSLNYKGLGISFILNYQIGGKVYDGTYAQLMHSGAYGTASHSDMLKRWQKPGDITDVPRMDAGRSTIFTATSDRFLQDASYLNIQNVILSYTLPKNIAGAVRLQNARFYVGGENLYIFNKKKGMNPLQNFTGVTSNAYMPARTITAGINLSL